VEIQRETESYSDDVAELVGHEVYGQLDAGLGQHGCLLSSSSSSQEGFREWEHQERERGAEELQDGIETFSGKDEHHLPKTLQH
jgi:hypothetical protein